MSFRHPAQVHPQSSLLTASSPTHTRNLRVPMGLLRPPSLKSNVWIPKRSSRLEIGHLSASIWELTIHSFDIRNTSLQTATSPSWCVMVMMVTVGYTRFSGYIVRRLRTTSIAFIATSSRATRHTSLPNFPCSTYVTTKPSVPSYP
jgi:hypothetical protein